MGFVRLNSREIQSVPDPSSRRYFLHISCLRRHDDLALQRLSLTLNNIRRRGEPVWNIKANDITYYGLFLNFVCASRLRSNFLEVPAICYFWLARSRSLGVIEADLGWSGSVSPLVDSTKKAQTVMARRHVSCRPKRQTNLVPKPSCH